jgi:tetratricopeptide (TPR) repeat protein
MADNERLSALIAEYRALDRSTDAAKMRPILAEAAQLVDRAAEPKKWAAFRSMFGKVADEEEPEAALTAYLDALTVWDPESDHDYWVECHSSAGMLLTRLFPVGSRRAGEAILHLECAVADQPFLAKLLGTLYRSQVTGDPAENWRRRFRYFQMALTQVSPVEDPGEWADRENELGIAYTDEPSGDFAQGVEKRISCHMAALYALSQAGEAPARIDSYLNLSEAYLFRVLGDGKQNHQLAEFYLRQAAEASNEQTPADLRRKAFLALARLLSKQDGAETAAQLREALTYCDRASELIDPVRTPELMGNVEGFRVNAYAGLIRMGEPKWIESISTSLDSALRLFNPAIHAHQRSTILHAAGGGFLEAGDFSRASLCLEQALSEGEAALQQSTTIQGRVESVFRLGDASALWAYCYLELGDMWKALEALDRGKARFWRTESDRAALDALPRLIPDSGAALFPVFAWKKGAVISVVREGDGLRYQTVWLPEFGKVPLLELQRGLSWRELGGWLKAYSFRHSQPENWVRAINTMGGELHKRIWEPVLLKLGEMGIGRGAELLWFPQGGSGLLPMHAAWKEENGQRRWLVQDYAVRYVPSVHALALVASKAPPTAPSLLIGDPDGDLGFSDLECAWVERSLGKDGVRAFHGVAATKEAVLAALPGCRIAHLSTHASFDFTDPFSSYISVANQQRITLRELLPLLANRAPGFVALSSCESAMARVTSTPDEFLGFPAAFLEHGTRTVLATLWPVDDFGASVVVQRFYGERARTGISAAEALRRAQDWARTVTNAELVALVRELRGEPAPVGPFINRSVLPGLLAADAKACPLAEPYFWGAFTITGE